MITFGFARIKNLKVEEFTWGAWALACPPVVACISLMKLLEIIATEDTRIMIPGR